MEINELRVGNILEREYETGSVTDGVYQYVVDCTTFERFENNKEFITELYPIPLTEEWLLKFAFEKSGQWFVYKNFPIQVNVSLIHNKVTFGYNEEYEIAIKPFVHAMQNLIFALTGQELTSK